MSSPTCSLPEPSSLFDAWVDHCQVLIDRQWPDLSIKGDALLDLVTSLPAGLTAAQQERAGHLLARLFCRFVSTLDRRVVSDLARGALSDDGVSEWFTASHRLAAVVVRASGLAGGAPPRPPSRRNDPRVARALAEIDRHFSNPRFGLRATARGVALSDCRLTQLLKASTGRTFGAHLHHRRIVEAQTLLHDLSLSIKEIAARVGYQSTTQLDRQFKKMTLSLPSVYRASIRSADRDTVIAESARPPRATKLTHTKQQT
jgi:AraC-like DNA-binding protein